MSYANTAHCDICDRPRGQTNHWFQARVSANQIIIEPFVAKSRGVKHLCGEGCMAKFLAGGTPGKPGALAMLHGVVPVATDLVVDYPILSGQEV